MVRVKDIPEGMRWRMATRVLTRLVVALGRAPPGNRDLSRCTEQLFAEMGDEIRLVADRYSMPREHAADLVQTMGAVSVILFGPAFETRFIEGFPDEAVIRLTECALFRDERAPDIPPSGVHAVCTAYVRHAIDALNPAFGITITRSMCCGDPFCEMVITRKRG
ncbi:MAG TPA: hypothetical protein ENN85_05070 [Methanoculleus sp.]|nr:hypothetical protein [Methanoculleus sp.]